MPHPIDHLLQQPEGKTLEFKRDLSSPRNVLKTLVAHEGTAAGEVFDEQPMPELGLDDLDTTVMSRVFGPTRALDEKALQTLKLLRAEQGRLVPTRGAALLFGKAREQHFPDAWIQGKPGSGKPGSDPNFHLSGGVSGGVNDPNDLFTIIQSQPGLRTTDLVRATDTPRRTIERWLQQLKAAGQIKFRGAAKQVEHEVAALRALKILGALPDNADEYTLVTTLRITKSKARNLLYQDALRNFTSPQQIDDALRALVMQPTATKDGDLILLEVPQRFLMDALRHRVRQLGFLSDGSFACSIARIPQRVLAALIEDLIPPAERKFVAAQLRLQGIEGNDLQSLIAGLIRTAGRAAAGSAGEHLGIAIAEGLGAAFNYGAEQLGRLSQSSSEH
jgi:hypothetical protein